MVSLDLGNCSDFCRQLLFCPPVHLWQLRNGMRSDQAGVTGWDGPGPCGADSQQTSRRAINPLYGCLEKPSCKCLSISWNKNVNTITVILIILTKWILNVCSRIAPTPLLAPCVRFVQHQSHCRTCFGGNNRGAPSSFQTLEAILFASDLQEAGISLLCSHSPEQEEVEAPRLMYFPFFP